MNIKENYQQYVSRYASEVAALKRKNTGFITEELLAFGGILAFLICYFALDGEKFIIKKKYEHQGELSTICKPICF